MNRFEEPDWIPRLTPGTRVLVAGASGGLGRALVTMLLEGSDCVIGAHGGSKTPTSVDPRVIPLRQSFNGAADCEAVVDAFVEQAGGIDALVTLSGAIHFSGHWKDMPEDDWEQDMAVNLNQPFYLARAAMRHMTDQGTGGRILLNGTESALHGGSGQSFPYAVAKRGTECMVQGLAREGAPHNILVNGVRFGYIKSGFHQRWHEKSEKDMSDRAELVPLKRGGEPREAAALMIYLLSGWSAFITGQMIPLTGGDWL
ncbi:SDR family NAD(P)-dependent oxidoreductase [Magnetospira sp. QH-2]|uniref:SDR family NAD(P)-dependent oxidoreductase n=1 Tax=Magnetospira sp. (strain QH-2) TaxID=1288970 RepID=UPI0003E817F7|nr:SDR family oxidoreductase [Magnetospira sp. QH-2]CCQ75494.1 putative 3-oxoacyl-[acyl-carrier-protein] reductase [Magnetospira sp. QH-2]